MPRFDTADVQRYYDRYTDNFVSHGPGSRVGALHRAVWTTDIKSPEQAFRYTENRLLRYLDTLPLDQVPHIVDLGCGVGASLCYLATQISLKGTGLTLSPVQVQHAKQRIDRAGLANRITCIEADYCALPDTLPTADVAYAIESFVHSSSPERFFAGCAKCIRTGGLLMICDDFRCSTPDPRASREVARFQQGWHLNSLLYHDELIELAHQAGFEHLSTDDLTPYLRLGTLRDRFASLFVKTCGWLPLENTQFGHLVGGTALQTCLAKGWIGYYLSLFRRSQ
ncbi:MAG: hypothetical protein CL484_14895 [Acidobacteria bacterium]|nr:hypothetical protein [Acidobacteriota bacterium]